MGDFAIKALGTIGKVAGAISDAQYERMTDGWVSDVDVHLASDLAKEKKFPGADELFIQVARKCLEQTETLGGNLKTLKEDVKDLFAIIGETKI